jgi:hypothetical protein
MQLDIFEHSRDVMLRNDVMHALDQRDSATAHLAWEILAREFPHDESLPALFTLIKAIEARDREAFCDHDALCRARQTLHGDIQPAAIRVFGDKDAAFWLCPLWQDLAQRSGRLAFRVDRDEEHAAPLWLRAQNWTAAAEAVVTIESWRRIPAPLAWMTEARLGRVNTNFGDRIHCARMCAWRSPPSNSPKSNTACPVSEAMSV